MTYYHGGLAGLKPGDLVRPAPAHVFDGCYLCVARQKGRAVTIGEYRGYLLTRAARGDNGARQMLQMLADAPVDAVIDPPSYRSAVYVTTDVRYATFYASRSKGDLYEVRPLGELTPSWEDHFPSWTVDAALVTKVLRRGVRRSRHERRELNKEWAKADKRAEAAH